MGWAKYTEDNIEIALERLSQMEEKKADASRRYEKYPEYSSSLKSSHMYNSADIRKEPAVPIQPVKKPAAPVHPAVKSAPFVPIQPVKRKDKKITCELCGKKFLFSVEDQIDYQKRGWAEPERCPKCRPLWKAMKERQFIWSLMLRHP